MINPQNHIVHQCQWLTSFDNQSRAYELQNTLSSWSHIHLERVLSEVLDKFSVEGTHLRLETLKLDLGEIPMEELESTLSLRVTQCLEESLNDLIFEQNGNMHKAGQITQETSELEVVRFFLINGVYPWYYQRVRSLDSLMDQQISKQKSPLLALISEVGKEEYVRKRLVWQLEEKGIKKLIVAMEPVHHSFVTHFSEELIHQPYENGTVSNNQSKFRKDVWYWVLTHLIVERGSTFNKKSFISSSIVQMASSYQLQYTELLSHIVSAMSETSKKSSHHIDFISILTMLSSEGGSHIRIGRVEKSVFSELKDINPNDKGEVNRLINHKIQNGQSTFFQELIGDRKFYELLQNLTTQNKLGLIKSVFGERTFLIQLLCELDIHTLQHLKTKDWEKIFKQRKKNTTNQVAQIAQVYADIAEQTENSLALIRQSIKLFSEGHITSLHEARICAEFINQVISNALIRNKQQFLQALKEELSNSLRTRHGKREVTCKLLELWVHHAPDSFIDYLRTNDAHQIGIQPILFSLSAEKLDRLLERLPERQSNFLSALNALADEFNLPGCLSIREYIMYLTAEKGGLQKVADEWVVKWVDVKYSGDTLFLSKVNQLFRTYGLASIENTESVYKRTIRKALASRDNNQLRGLFLAGVALPGKIEEEIFARCFPQSDKQLAHYLKKYVSLLKESSGQTPKNNEKVRQLMLKMLFSFELHKGDERLFEKLVYQILCHHFDLRNDKHTNFSEPTAFSKLEQNLSKRVDAFDQLRFCLKENRKAVSFNGSSLSLAAILLQCLEFSPSMVRNILISHPLSDQAIALLKENIDIRCFLGLIYADKPSREAEIADEMLVFFKLIETGVQNTMDAKMQGVSWNKIIQGLSGGFDEALLSGLVRVILDQIAHNDLQSISHAIINSSTQLPPILAGVLEKNKVYVAENSLLLEKEKDSINLSQELCENVFTQWIGSGQIPDWFEKEHAKQEVRQLVRSYPLTFLAVLRKSELIQRNISNILESLDSFFLIKILIRIYPAASKIMHDFGDTFFVISKLQIKSKIVDHMVLKLLLKAWKSGKWETLSASHIWIKIANEVAMQSTSSLDDFFTKMEEVSSSLPTNYRISLKLFMEKRHIRSTDKPILHEGGKRATSGTNTTIEFTKVFPPEGICVSNAGLIIVNSFFKMLFDRLDLLEGNTFRTRDHQEAAVHYLQYVALGKAECDEADLVLNKVLSGIPIHHPLPGKAEISETEINIIDGMVQASVDYWPAVGSSSVHGFRGNWFVREGLLFEKDEYWSLVVEKRAYDILLNQSPFSFSIIKFPWMPKPLKVDWPY